jgi:hypothetical protein
MSMGYQQQPRAGGVKPPSGQKTAQRASSSSSGNVAMSHGMQSNMTKRISGAKEQEPDFIAQVCAPTQRTQPCPAITTCMIWAKALLA